MSESPTTNDHRPKRGAAAPPIPEELRGAWDKLVTPVRRAPTPSSPALSAPSDSTRGDQFEIIRQLGVVDGVRHYEAWDRVARLEVGIREVADGGRANPAAAEDFWHRARSQARQRHSNLLGVFSLAPERGWVITELCRRSIVDEIVENPLSPERARAVLAAALAGLDHLHRRGQVHGAIQPAAFLLDNDGVVKLDFASGREVGAELVLRPGQERYAAPETLDEQRFGRVTAAVDLYALGITMLELLAGDKFDEFFADAGVDMHDGGDGWLRWHMSATARLAPLQELAPELPPSLAKVIERMLEKHVDDRWSSAGAALEALSAGALAPIAPVGEWREPARSVGLAPMPVVRNESSLAVRTIEPATLAPYERPPRVEATATLQVPGSPRVQRIVDRVTDKKNANAIALAMLLVAAFVAGLSALIPSSPEAELAEVDRAPRTESPRSTAHSQSIVDSNSTDEANEVVTEPAGAGGADELDFEAKPEREVPPVEPPPPRPARLVLAVEPAQAWVKIDGRPVNGPLPQFVEVEPGAHVITAGKWDFTEGSVQIEAAPGEFRNVSLRLEPRPLVPAYEPVLVGSSPLSRQADAMVAEILDKSPSPGVTAADQVRAEYAIRRKFPQMYAADPRVAHALAVAAFDRGSYNHAVRLYNLSARHAPATYSWPHKGLVRSLLAEGRMDDALDALAQFILDGAASSGQASAGVAAEGPFDDAFLTGAFLADAAAFAGQTIAFAESTGADPGAASLAARQLTDAMTPSARQAFDTARAELLARFVELGYDRGENWSKLVAQCLGDSVVSERRALRASISARQRLDGGDAVPWHVRLISRPTPSNGIAASPLAVRAAGL